MFETVVTMVGRVVGELTHHRYGDDKTVVRFRLVAQERRYDQESRGWTDGERMFVSVSCWREKLADNVAASLTRGDSVLVMGRLYHREHDSPELHRLSVHLDAYAIGPDLSRWPVTINRAPAQPAPPVTAAA